MREIERALVATAEACAEHLKTIARLREQIAAKDEALKEAKDELVRLRDRYETAHSEVVISRISAALTNTTEGGKS